MNQQITHPRPRITFPRAPILGAALLTLATHAIAQRPSEQNVLVLIADDVGIDGIGCYGAGSSPPPTPNIDALAARGVRMTRAHASPTCSPTRACIQTGQYPFRTGVGSPVDHGADGLASAETLLPEVLAASQRPRAMFGKWHLGGDDDSDTPNLEGWPHFEGTLGGELDNYFHFDLIKNGELETVHSYATSDTVDRTLAWIGTQDRPWLAMVCFNAGHSPLHDPPALLHTYALNGLTPEQRPKLFFKAMVQAMDTEIGRLLTGLGAARLANTTVIFLGDNGTLGTLVEDPFVSDHAKATLYEGGIQVPMIVAGPAVVGPPRTCGALVDAVDLFTTIAALCGVNARSVVPASEYLDGQDLRPLLRGTATSVRAWSFAEQFDQDAAKDGYAMQDTRFKLIRFTGGTSVREEMYDLQIDPYETDDLLAVSAGLDAEAQRAYTRLRIAIAQLRGETFAGNFGSGCAGAAGAPVLSAGIGPRLGQTHLVRAAPLGSAVAVFGMFGFSMTTTGSMPLPLNMSALGLTGCWLLVSPDISHVAVLGTGSATWPMPIPAEGALLGLAFYQQMAIVEPGANPAGVILSDGIANVIGA